MSKVESRVSRAAGSVGISGARPSTFDPRRAFTLIEVMVVVVLLAFIVIALMAVFTGTQKAFRSTITQTDVLEGGRAAMDLITGDLRQMSPSLGLMSSGGVNFAVIPTNSLVQSLAASSQSRTNILEKVFILSRQNQTWTAVGYVVDPTSTNSINPLYRFSMNANVAAADPRMLYNIFNTNSVAGMSHLLDGVVDFRVSAFDPNGTRINLNGNTNVPNVLFFTTTTVPGESQFYMFSNTLPAAVEIQMATLEDRVLSRAESIFNSAARSNYLSQQAGTVHVFRQRVSIPNADPSAYQ